MNLNILSSQYLSQFTEILEESPIKILNVSQKEELPVDYFQFYNSVSSVYSSKIEGENIDFDSYFKHKFLNVTFKPDYTQKADDLFTAYEFIESNSLTLKHVQDTHSILTSNLLPKSQRGQIRTNPMFVINSEDRIDYIAARPELVENELHALFEDIESLLKTSLNDFEIFYYASFIHLVFVKIHPFQDGNGRTARLLEKWFLKEKIGKKATSIPLEKNYYQHLDKYYQNLKKLGIDYDELDYNKAIDFLLMTAQGLSS
ncbi:MAG: Fic family protein [Flavobacteriales bacterium]